MNKTLVEWLDDLDPRSFYKSDVLMELEDFGFDVEFHAADGSRANYYTISNGVRSTDIHVNTWQDDFEALASRGLPFFVIDEDHLGKPKEMERYGTGFAIVNPQDVDMNTLAAIGAGFIYKNAEALAQTTVVGSAIFRGLASVVAGETPGDQYHGRGFAAQANLSAITMAMGVVQ